MAEELFGKINKVGDMDNPSDLEKKHIPWIEAPDDVKPGEPFEVKVEVGHLLSHPNEPGHHIQWIALLNGSVTIAIVQLTPVSSSPTLSFTVTLEEDGELRALERCNLHGEWEHSRKVKVR